MQGTDSCLLLGTRRSNAFCHIDYTKSRLCNLPTLTTHPVTRTRIAQRTAQYSRGLAMSPEKHRPLVSVTESDQYQPPIVEIPQRRVDALSLHAHERAKYGPGTIQRHERGILGEYAVAKYLGAPNALDTTIYEHGDPGYDLEINGQTIDVKTPGSQANNPELWVDASALLNADFYALVHQLNRTTYRLIGYAPRRLVKDARERLIHLDGYSDRVRAVPQNLLPLF